MNEQAPLPLRHTIINPETDMVTSLFEIVSQYKRGLILKPLHQRSRVWSDEKDHDWVNRLRSDRKIVGCLLTYQLIDGRPSPVFLNDGLQRTLATLRYLEESHLFGDDHDTAEAYCRKCMMPVQHRHYESHDDALIDFQLVNLGTHLTPYEFNNGILAYMGGDGPFWQGFFQQLHDLLSNTSSRITASRYTVTRPTQHKYYRHDYGLLYRLLSDDKDVSSYNVSAASVDIGETRNRKCIEWLLRLKLEELGPNKTQAEFKKFEQLIERETALIEELWYKQLGKEIGTGISDTLYRWLLDCAIWKRNNRIPHAKWEQFARKLLTISDGRSQVITIGPDQNAQSYTLSLSALHYLKGICEMIDSDFYSGRTQRRSRRKSSSIRPGFDDSHYLPFSSAGEGPTFGEPGGRNRARGAQPV